MTQAWRSGTLAWHILCLIEFMTSRLKVAVLGAVLLVGGQATAIPQEDFVSLIRSHRLRVLRVARLAFGHFPSSFPGVSYPLLDAYMNLHDAPKIYSLEQLRRYGYPGSRSFVETFAPLYGRGSGEINSSALATIRDLNRVESQMKAEFFQAKSISSSVQGLLEKLEEIADIVDTRTYRRGELQIDDPSATAEKFFRDQGKMEQAEIARWLQSRTSFVLEEPAPPILTLPFIECLMALTQ